MNARTLTACLATAAILASATTVIAQPRDRQPFMAGEPLGVTEDDVFTPLTPDARVFGGIVGLFVVSIIVRIIAGLAMNAFVAEQSDKKPATPSEQHPKADPDRPTPPSSGKRQ